MLCPAGCPHGSCRSPAESGPAGGESIHRNRSRSRRTRFSSVMSRPILADPMIRPLGVPDRRNRDRHIDHPPTLGEAALLMAFDPFAAAQPLQQPHVVGPRAPWCQPAYRLVDGPPHHFGGGVTQQALGSLVPGGDHAIHRRRHNRVLRSVHDRRQAGRRSRSRRRGFHQQLVFGFGAGLPKRKKSAATVATRPRQQARNLSGSGAPRCHGFIHIHFGNREPGCPRYGAYVRQHRHTAIIHTLHEAPRPVAGHDRGIFVPRQGDAQLQGGVLPVPQLIEEQYRVAIAPHQQCFGAAAGGGPGYDQRVERAGGVATQNHRACRAALGPRSRKQRSCHTHVRCNAGFTVEFG